MKDIIYYFSDGLFYPSNEEYREIPANAIPVTAEGFSKAMNRQPGESFTVDNDGTIAIIPVPPVTHEQQVAQAEYQRRELRANADSAIVWREDATEDGSATEEEAAALVEWRKYRVKLMRIDTSKAPDIEWPTPPGQN